MTTSSTGSRRSPAEPDPLHPLTARLFINTKLQCVLDCVQRASDGMERDDENRITWTYVAGQILAAEKLIGLASSMAMALAEAQDKQDVSAVANGAQTVEELLTKAIGYPPVKGGEA